jgi:hypothetical protein
MELVITPVEGDRDLRPTEGLNGSLEDLVDLPLIELQLSPAFWGPGATIDEVDGAVGVLKVFLRLVGQVFTITLGQVVSVSSAMGAFGATRLFPVVVARTFWFVLGHTIAECMTLSCGVVGVLVP